MYFWRVTKEYLHVHTFMYDNVYRVLLFKLLITVFCCNFDYVALINLIDLLITIYVTVNLNGYFKPDSKFWSVWSYSILKPWIMLTVVSENLMQVPLTVHSTWYLKTCFWDVYGKYAFEFCWNSYQVWASGDSIKSKMVKTLIWVICWVFTTWSHVSNAKKLKTHHSLYM